MEYLVLFCTGGIINKLFYSFSCKELNHLSIWLSSHLLYRDYGFWKPGFILWAFTLLLFFLWFRLLLLLLFSWRLLFCRLISFRLSILFNLLLFLWLWNWFFLSLQLIFWKFHQNMLKLFFKLWKILKNISSIHAVILW